MPITRDKLIEKNVARIGAVKPQIKELMIEITKRAYAEKIYVLFTSGLRTLQDQAYIYGQGRKTFVWNGKEYAREGSIVSNAKPGQSIHNYGLALDFVLVDEDGNNPSWNVNAQWKRVAEIAKTLGFAWGGDWTEFKDYPHIEYRKGLSFAQLLANKIPAFPQFISIDAKEEKEVKPVENKPKTRYSDVGTSHSAYNALEALSALNIINGYSDGTFKPNEPVTRAQVAIIVYRLLKHLKG